MSDVAAMSDNDDDDRDCEVGYGRPPHWSLYRKGESGNRDGRPPRKWIQRLVEASATDDVVRAELKRMLPFSENGKRQRTTVLKLLMKALLKNALEGETNALKIVFTLSQALDKNDAERAHLLARKKEEDFRNAKRFLQMRRRIWSGPASAGDEPQDSWPHPDDILLDQANLEWRVRGPRFAREVPQFEYYRAERDAALGTFLLDLEDCDEPLGAMHRLMALAWLTWDRVLPLRWQVWPQYDARVLELTLTRRRLWDWTKSREAEALRLRPQYPSAKEDRATKRKAKRMLKTSLAKAGIQAPTDLEEVIRQL